MGQMHYVFWKIGPWYFDKLDLFTFENCISKIFDNISIFFTFSRLINVTTHIDKHTVNVVYKDTHTYMCVCDW